MQAIIIPIPGIVHYATTATPTLSRPLERPGRPASFRQVAGFLAVLAGSSLLADSVLFRSGLYTRLVEPESATGNFELTFHFEKARAPGRKDILMLGSSRMAEGFSPKAANVYKPEYGYRFLSAAIPSAGPRVFYYMLRDLDPHCGRYAAITIPIDDYDDPENEEVVADRASDMWLVIHRLRFADILPFTLSFRSWNSRGMVFRGALFKGTVYQRDIADFIEHPKERLARVRMFRKSGDTWAYDYTGIPHNLAGMTIDWGTRRITFPPGIPPDTQHLIENAYFSNLPQTGKMREFEARWLGAIADRYRGSRTRIIFFESPRRPVPLAVSRLPWTAVDDLRKRPWVTVVDRHQFESLERPELFADHVHLSADGRRQFTPMLVDTVREILH